MSKINYQALREAAEKAPWGDWDSYKPHRGARGYEVRLSKTSEVDGVLRGDGAQLLQKAQRGAKPLENHLRTKGD